MLKKERSALTAKVRLENTSVFKSRFSSLLVGDEDNPLILDTCKAHIFTYSLPQYPLDRYLYGV